MKFFLFVSILLVVAFVSAGCLGQDAINYTNDNIDEQTDSVLDDVDIEESAEADDAEVDSSGVGVVDVDDEIVSEPAKSENIIVETPLPNSSVTSPFEVSGQARVFEGTVLVRVVNQDGKIVVPEQIVNAHANEQGEFGAFKININYVFYATKEGIVEVFSQSAENGEEINMVEVPIKFE